MMGIMTTTVDSSDSMPERLQEGSVAPDFTLPAVIPGFTESGSINLSDVLDAGRRVVLYFYPAAMTPGCTTQAIDFTAHADEFDHAGFDVLGGRDEHGAAAVEDACIVQGDPLGIPRLLVELHLARGHVGRHPALHPGVVLDVLRRGRQGPAHERVPVGPGLLEEPLDERVLLAPDDPWEAVSTVWRAASGQVQGVEAVTLTPEERFRSAFADNYADLKSVFDEPQA